MNNSSSTDEEYFLLGTGTWRDLLPRIPRPVLALSPKVLYRVLLEGSGFVLPVVQSARPVVGFFTARFVAARARLEAEETAKSAVLRDWRRQGFDTRTSVLPDLRIDNSEALRTHFRLRSGEGFTFFGDSDDA